jgi:hypothetical protein
LEAENVLLHHKDIFHKYQTYNCVAKQQPFCYQTTHKKLKSSNQKLVNDINYQWKDYKYRESQEIERMKELDLDVKDQAKFYS